MPCWSSEQMNNSKFAAMLGQVRRYGIVGVLNNLLGYLIYLLITWFWLDPKIVVILMYPIGAVTAYYGHAKYTFSYNASHSHALVRYIIAHLIGYGTNIGMLYFFWNQLGYPHQLVQAVAILVVAGVFFLLSRYFVFSERYQSS